MKEDCVFNKKSTEERMYELQHKWNSFELELPITYPDGRTIRTRGYKEAWAILWQDNKNNKNNMNTMKDIIVDAIGQYPVLGSSIVEELSERLGIAESVIIATMTDYGITVDEAIEKMTEEEYDTALSDCAESIIDEI